MGTHAKLQASGTRAGNATGAATSLRDAIARFYQEVAIMEECKTGSDYTELEATYGATTGDGVTVYDEFTAVKGHLDSATSLRTAVDAVCARVN